MEHMNDGVEQKNGKIGKLTLYGGKRELYNDNYCYCLVPMMPVWR